MTWYEILFLKYLKGLPSKARMFLKLAKGGTMQLLPENDDEPETSPFKGVIRYPDTSSDVEDEFTYKQSSYTGQARIKSIKGNTLVWNQYVSNQGTTSSNYDVTYTNNGDNSWDISGTSTGSSTKNFNGSGFSLGAGHVYYVSGCPSGGSPTAYFFGVGGISNDIGNGAIWKNTNNYTTGTPTFAVKSGTTVNFTNLKFIISDLTQMFGSTKADEIYAMETAHTGDGVAYFRSLFPLNYYAYNSGSLLNFNGTGIKTTGKNLFSSEIVQGALYGTGNENNISTTRCKTGGYIEVQPNTTYVASIVDTCKYVSYVFYDSSKTYISGDGFNAPFTFTTPPNCAYVRFGISKQTTSQTIRPSDVSNTQLEIGSSSSTYEPYTSSTLSLPISTYFPTGMKSAGGVYDELSDKAITRVRSVDLGTLTWSSSQQGSIYLFVSNSITDMVTGYSYTTPKEEINITGMPYDYRTLDSGWGSMTDKTFGMAGRSIRIRDDSYADATAFKNAMSGVYLNYELATYTEQDVDPEDTQIMLNRALSTVLGRNVSVDNPQEALDILTKGE